MKWCMKQSSLQKFSAQHTAEKMHENEELSAPEPPIYKDHLVFTINVCRTGGGKYLEPELHHTFLS